MLRFDDYKPALRRQRALRSGKAAEAIVPSQLHQLFFGSRSVVDRTGLMLLWITASRCSDIQRLRRQDFKQVAPVLWDICFPGHTASEQRVVDRSALPAEMEVLLGDVLQLTASEDSRPFANLGHRRVTSWLREVDVRYTSYSIRVGALVALLNGGTAVSVVQTKAKHQDLRMLQHHYAPGEVAEALGTAQAARLLYSLAAPPQQ
jgi:integrase